MIIFKVRHPDDYHPLVENADMTLDIMDAHMQIGSFSGDLVVYDLVFSVIDETGTNK